MPVPLLAELKRRRVFRVLIGYGIASFAVLQVIEPIMHALHLPEVTLTYVVVALALGFPVALVLAWAFDVKDGRIERTAPSEPATAGQRPRRARVALVLVGLGLLAATPGLVWYFGFRRPATLAHRAPAAQAPGPSIAVLPLVNLSSEREQEYFSDGLSEELLNVLSKVPGLRVAARTSAFAFKGKNEDVATIAQKLHVATILEGSVRKAGDQIRITTQLVNAADGYHLWSETYDRRLTDVFAVQDDIAQAVVAALKLKLLQAPTSKDRRTANPEAYNQYLLGRQFFRRNNVADFRRAQQAFEKAVALDPQYAPAWAGLALATFWVADASDSAAEVASGQDRAVEAANKAIAVGTDLPDGYLARGFVRIPIQWDWQGSRADMERAMVLRPGDPDSLAEYASVMLRLLNRLPEAIADLRRVTESDPLNPRVWSALGASLAMNGQRAEAREAFNRSLEISPDQSFTPYNLSLTLLLDGQPAEALAASQRSTNEVFRLAGAALAQHALGREEEARRALDQMIARWGHGGAYQIAQNYAWRGDRDPAFDWLERAVKQRDGGLVNIKVDPMLATLRRDRRYAALLKKMNLPPD